jgi:hypothetical protein
MRFKPLMFGLLVAVPLSVALPAHATDTEPGEMDEALLAKTARARAKSSGQMRQRDKSGQSLQDDQDGKGLSPCGVNIGNAVNTKPGKAPKEIIVVVKGDVINANNRCK